MNLNLLDIAYVEQELIQSHLTTLKCGWGVFSCYPPFQNAMHCESALLCVCCATYQSVGLSSGTSSSPHSLPSILRKEILLDTNTALSCSEQRGIVNCDFLFRYDHDNKRPRGFGFVTFVNEEGVDAVFTGGSLQTLHDKPIEIKRAVPRDQIASARGRPSFAQTPRLFTSPGQVEFRYTSI